MAKRLGYLVILFALVVLFALNVVPGVAAPAPQATASLSVEMCSTRSDSTMTYSITLVNNSSVDVGDVFVAGLIPEGTSFARVAETPADGLWRGAEGSSATWLSSGVPADSRQGPFRYQVSVTDAPAPAHAYIAWNSPSAGNATSRPAGQCATVEVPFLDEWVGSGHADATSEAFVHWDAENPPVVPVGCAKCHSGEGYRDFVGADGSAFGVVDTAPMGGQVISCVTCHNEAAIAMTSVEMPSGIVLENLGAEARCMQCHQGRSSKPQVDAAIGRANAATEDTVSAQLTFQNVHYYAAAATKYGTLAQGGYEYEGRTYDGNFAHVEQYDTCIGCHNPHSLEVKVSECATCHQGVETVADLRDIRFAASLVDYDGDGDTSEGILYEIEGLQGKLLDAIQAYAVNVSGKAIGYDSHSHPYFFIDTNANGQIEADEATAANRFNAFTPRLVKAAYNYQVSLKDPGNYAHGGKYIMQLLNDSITDLNSQLSEPVSLAAAHRNDAGHFAGSEEAFRHWDADGEVPSGCAKCHSADGLPTFLAEGVNVSQPIANGFQCTTCHDDLNTFSIYEIEDVKFPSGAVIDSGSGTTNLCIECHQGRTSKNTVDTATKGIADDTVATSLSFINVHYFASGATRYGTEAKGGYEYAGKSYAGYYPHVAGFSNCVDCHDTHGLTVKVNACATCHPGVSSVDDLHNIRLSAADYDGDGNTSEGVADEIAGLRAELLAAIQAYAANVAGQPIIYNDLSHPYFFKDTNANGVSDAGEVSAANRFNSWTPRLLRAGYNYQYATKDPGAFAHNGEYIAQILHDSLADLGSQVSIDVSGNVRP